MKYALNDLIDIPALQRLMEKLYAATGINHALIDNESNVHTAVGWQRICTDFHRVNPRTRAHCLKSDLYIKEHLHDGPYASYRCPHGLIDNAVPLIIDGEHLANLFTGQMLHAPPDLEFFREQARIYGFDEEAYVGAAKEIRIVPQERLPDIMGFLSDLAHTLAQSGLARLRQLEEERLRAAVALELEQERLRAAEAVRQHRNMLAQIMDSVPQSIFWKDLEGRYIGCNAVFAKAAGLTSSEDVVGKTDFDLPWPREEAEAYRAEDRAVTASNQPRMHIIEPLQQADGSRLWVDTSKIPLVDADGLPYGVLGVHEDITERKRAEDEVRRLRNLLGNIINSMPSVLIGVDAAGSVTQWNAEAERTTGVASNAAIGRSLADVFPAFASEMSRVKTAIEKRTALRDTTVAVQHSDQVRYSDVTIYPLVANCIEGAVIRIDDITERVRMEEMMIQTEKMMSVGGLAAGMAHEINNPLAGIMQNLQVLELYLTADTPKNRNLAAECGLPYEGLQRFLAKREVQAIISSVQTSSKRAAKIVGNMLSFSRKSDKGFTENDVAELLDKTIELAANDYDLKKKYDFRQIEIVRDYEPAPKILCETSQIQQVLLNILKNGAHAMAGHTGERKRFLLRIRPMDDAVRIEIQDTGPGMEEGTRKRVFEPFFTTKEIGHGTGLGLSVSYFIITENHGGSMDVLSVPGQGSTFIVTLPHRRENQ